MSDAAPVPGRNLQRMVDAATQPAARRSDEGPLGVFGEVRSLEARSLAGPVLSIDVASGAELIRQGEMVATFFVIRSGDAQLSCDGRTLGTLHAGDCFGEIDPAVENAQEFSVTAASPMRLSTFSAFGIARLCAAFPGMHQRLGAALPHG
jgi:CRP-like cAMP-binding protein